MGFIVKKCPNCGSEMEADVNFCTVCGTDLRNVSAANDQENLYRPDDFKYVKRKNYSYKKSESLKRLKKAEKKSKNSLWYQKEKKSTQSDFKTDAPELKK